MKLRVLIQNFRQTLVELSNFEPILNYLGCFPRTVQPYKQTRLFCVCQRDQSPNEVKLYPAAVNRIPNETVDTRQTFDS